MTEVVVGPETPRRPEVMDLLAAADAFAHALYPPESNHLLDVEQLCDPSVVFLVARAAGKAVGCGALVASPDGTGEVKRMFVADAARGLGVGRRLLAEIERLAVARGIRLLRLETGVRNAAALALYRAAGFRPRGPFGEYPDDPLSVFMERVLTEGRSL